MLTCKRRKERKKEWLKRRIRFKSNEPDSQSHDITFHCSYLYQFEDSSLNSSLENCDTKTLTEIGSYGITDRPNPVKVGKKTLRN